MSKSLIYTSNESVQALAAGSTISLGNVVRRFGQNIRLYGNGITVCGAGYYKVSANITITGTTAGTAVITMLKDGTAYSGATRSISVAVGDIITVPIEAVVREYGCCADDNSNLTFVLSGVAESITDIAVVVSKE